MRRILGCAPSVWLGAHARTGDAASISGYVGKGKALAKAFANFAVAYADQTESDHRALGPLEAIESGSHHCRDGHLRVAGDKWDLFKSFHSFTLVIYT